MKSLTKKEQAALQLFKERLHERFADQMDSLQVFGSKARGEASKFSDIDVLVILKGTDWPSRHAVHGAAHDVFLETDVDLSPSIFSARHAAQLRAWGSPLFENIDREGVTL